MIELKIAFITTATLAGLLLLFILFFKPIKNAICKRNFVRIYGRGIYQIALDNDFYLINQFGLLREEGTIKNIDHILFGTKWIFVIKDCYYPGAISAKENDASWIHYLSRKKKHYIDNPLKVNAKNVKDLSMITQIDINMLISVVVINDDCLIGPFERTSRTNFLVPRNQIRKLINALENQEVEAIDEEALDRAVKEIDRLNLNHKR
ncbi:MAG: nuclease-related domain-containing protein [Bacilli bacterium]|jgi:hypothetical protein